MAAIRAAELETLKRKDTTGWTEKRKSSHEAAIQALTSKVEADALHIEKIAKHSTSKSTASVTTRTPIGSYPFLGVPPMKVSLSAVG